MLNKPVILDHFKFQADICRRMGSEFTARLCDHLPQLLDPESKTGSIIEQWQGNPDADVVGLRLCGALQSIIISDPDDPLNGIYANNNHPEFPDLLKQALNTHDLELSKWLNLPPQTNETGRAAALLPGLLEVSRQSNLPIHVAEIGSSAGLNLQLNHFHYDYDGHFWGNDQAPVRLNPEMKGNIPDLTGELNLASSIGCDIAPLDINDEFQRLRLISYIWPDQTFRAQRIRGAIELALEHQPQVLKSDAADFVEQQLTNRPDNHAFVLMHTVVWQYLPEQTKKRIEDSLTSHGANATTTNPIYWLRMEWHDQEEQFARLMLDHWPNHRSVTLANSCFHCNWIEFL